MCSSDLISDAHIMYNLCFTKNELYNGAFAIAHQQIDNKDPLRFYVTNEKDIIINSVIVRHTRHTVNSDEGCLSFPIKKMIVVQRWHKCEVMASTLNKKGEITKPALLQLKGRDSFISQHEVGHFDCNYIFELKK